MSILDRINSPADLKPLTRDELRAVSADMRERLIEVCSRTGGHIGAGLGVVELTVALHAVFDTPRDKIRTRFSPGVPAGSRRFGRRAASPAFYGGARANTTRSVPVTRGQPYRPGTEWRSLAI